MPGFEVTTAELLVETYASNTSSSFRHNYSGLSIPKTLPFLVLMKNDTSLCRWHVLDCRGRRSYCKYAHIYKLCVPSDNFQNV
ncbi:hypothetical protein AQUCO_03000297v1 [Aquilegia coerulea]|uniref:C3H1-type domain-containing protein n=1 Tax=Aquilegia coerulea TaxID=218851 RepID=A0A2G5D291_AQUCA|nr:hypothetical protein AQUCO_03000297v1 [Aquilegia coerulea]